MTIVFVSVLPATDGLKNIIVENRKRNYSISKLCKPKYIFGKVLFFTALLLFKMAFSPYKKENHIG